MAQTSSLAATFAEQPTASVTRIRDKPAHARSCRIVSLTGLTNYTDALRLQYAAQAAVRDHATPDTLYLLEHRPVITIGRAAVSRDAHLITPREELIARGIDVIETDRGGDITYHAPGQLVGYSVVDLQNQRRDLHHYLRSLESVIVCALADIGVPADTLPGLTGVWVGNRKIAAIGIKVSRWVTMHGFSINIDPELSVMREDIVPCGIAVKGVTSLQELGIRLPRENVETIVANQWRRAFCGSADASLSHSQWRDELAFMTEAAQHRSAQGDNFEG